VTDLKCYRCGEWDGERCACQDGQTILQGDCVQVLPQVESESVNCCVTSPPYWGLRDYGVDGQLGLEATPDEYVAKMVQVFGEVRRVLRDDGTLWLNLGDSYARQAGDDQKKSTDSGMRTGRTGRSAELFKSGNNKPPEYLKPKDLCGIPWRVAFALQADGWYLRQDIIWHKPNPMPESVRDRCTKAHEYIFLMSKSGKYYYDAEAIKGRQRGENGGGVEYDHDTTKSNKRSVWTVTTQPYPGAHFATFPPKLIEPCILAGCPEGGVVLDPFLGSGTTSAVARPLGRRTVGVELSRDYSEIAANRLRQSVLDF
jgi:DNA modification methylase